MSRLMDGNLDGDLILSGYQKKLNTMKKKFFVLYKETTRECARLEYFDSIKKFKSGATPKRVVKLENCFNISRKLDTKYEYVIALATKDGGFGIVLENESDMLKWLQALLAIQHSISNKCELPSNFDHVWQVTVQKKNLAEERKIIGNYHVCLSPRSVTFIRIGPEKSSSGYIRTTNIQIPLNTIRRCGDSHCLFYMEVGRQCTIGPGELWMETEDPLVAQSMHKMISSAMSARSEFNGESMRRRSSSVTETSKPISFLDVGSNRPENKNYYLNQSANNNHGRGRCDSFPTRSRESSDYLNQSNKSAHMLNIPSSSVSHRPLGLPRHSTSPPLASPFGCTDINETTTIVEQEDTMNYLPFRFKSAERAIPEENSEDLMNSDNISFQKESYVAMAPTGSVSDSGENNNAQLEIAIDSNDATFLSSVIAKHCNTTQDLASQMRSINISSALSSDLEKEERPKRSYSIGSKIDKNKIKRIGNSNEILHDTNSVRVRAFSVGSRAKIPKCDLQRAVLFPRSRFNQSCTSNNSLNFGTDDAGYNKPDLNIYCDKKSTSAPILIQNNGQLPMNCMSDLMEIDFSKSSTHKTHVKSESGKSTECFLNELQSPLNFKSEFDILKPHSSRILKDPDESGYLEMRPVECSINKPISSTLSECVGKIPKSNNNSVVVNGKVKEIKNTTQGTNIQKGKILNQGKEPIYKTSRQQEHILTVGNSANQIKEEFDYAPLQNVTDISSVYSNISMQPISNTHIEEETSFSIFDAEKNIKRSSRPQISNEEDNLKNILPDKFQVENESFIETAVREQKSPGICEKNPVLMNASSFSSGQLSNRCKYSSMLRNNDVQILTNVVGSRVNELIVTGEPTVETKAQKSNTSISSPDTSSYELHYAKLDLPQSSSKESIKFHKTETDLSSVIKESDSYAKIDFEHSSDSSSSSKTVNN